LGIGQRGISRRQLLLQRRQCRIVLGIAGHAAFAGLQILQLRAQGFDGRHVRRLGGLQIGDLILQRCDLRG